MQPSLPDQFNSIPFNCYPCFISYSMSLCSLLCQINSIQFHLTAIPASSIQHVFLQPSLPDQFNSIPFNCYPCFISYSMSLCSLLCQINSIQFHLTAIPASSNTACLFAAFFARSIQFNSI